jgi:hypothetical protein
VNTLPDSLVRFEREFEDAIRRDSERHFSLRPRGGLVLRVGVVAAVAVGISLGALSLVPGGGATVVARATAALAVQPGTILHVVMTGRQTNADGSVSTWEDESWQQESPPYARRQIETTADSPRAESALVDGVDQLYDPSTNTVYTTPPSLPQAEQAADGSSASLTPAEQARLEQVKKAKLEAGPQPQPFRSEVLALLHSGDVREESRERVDGRDAIRIVSADGRTTYLVDATTYTPVRLVTENGGATTTLSFRVYEKLDTPGSDALVSLIAQHPNATVDASPADYAAADARLFPGG